MTRLCHVRNEIPKSALTSYIMTLYCQNLSIFLENHSALKGCISVACEQGKGQRKGKRKREGKGEPEGIHRYFDCSSFVIYAGPSINYSNARNNNNKTINCVA